MWEIFSLYRKFECDYIVRYIFYWGIMGFVPWLRTILAAGSLSEIIYIIRLSYQGSPTLKLKVKGFYSLGLTF